jgi:hypothetical protein
MFTLLKNVKNSTNFNIKHKVKIQSGPKQQSPENKTLRGFVYTTTLL